MSATSPKQERHESHSSEGEDAVAGTLAERRALHNSVERTRREALNAKFTHLAQQLPSLSHIHRPSKSVIISHCLDMIVDLRESKAQNEALRQEVLYLRQFIATGRQGPQASNNQVVSAPGQQCVGLESSLSPPMQSGRNSRRTPSPRDYSESVPGYASQMSMSNRIRPIMRPVESSSSSNLDMYNDKTQMSMPWTQPLFRAESSLSVPTQPAYQHIQYVSHTPSDQGPRLQSETSSSTHALESVDGLDIDASQMYPTEYSQLSAGQRVQSNYYPTHAYV